MATDIERLASVIGDGHFQPPTHKTSGPCCMTPQAINQIAEALIAAGIGGEAAESHDRELNEAAETQQYIAELEARNTRLAQQLIGYSDRANEAMRPYLAKAWFEGRDAGWRKGSLGHKMHCRSVGPNPYEEIERKES